MKMYRYSVVLGVALLAFATTAAALSLGRVRGTPLLGRGLDLSIQTMLEAQEALPEANCLSADIFYGESRVSPNSVSIVPERVNATEARIRVRSSAMIDEPVVTVFLRSTCGASVSRRYVLLAETLTDTEQPALVSPPVVLSRPASAPSNTSTPTLSIASPNASLEADTTSAAVPRSNARVRSREARPLPSASVEQRPRPVVRKSEQARSAKPRLQLDLLDLNSAELNLRGSVDLNTQPSSDLTVRSQAQALWRAINASPEDALRDAQRLEKLEEQMKSALEQSKRQSQDIATLTSELKASQRGRYANPFTLFLGLLTLMALGLSAWLWLRNSNNKSPWWRGASSSNSEEEASKWGSKSEDADEAIDTHRAPHEKTSPMTKTSMGYEESSKNVATEKQKPLKFVQRPTGPVPFEPVTGAAALTNAKIQPIGSSAATPRGGNMGRVDSTPPPSLMPMPASKKAGKFTGPNSRGFGHSDFGHSGFASSRLVSTEELFDVQEQADFFMSLGQPEQAVEVLKNHITDSVETSALAYMDLFDIYHRTRNQTEYEALRDEFNRVFNAQVPEFAKYSDQTLGLEEYPDVLAAIQASWPRPQEALEAIEETIFRQPDQLQQPFDMLAYRELMLLYAMTKELVKTVFTDSMLPIRSVIQNGDTNSSEFVDLSVDLDMLAKPSEISKMDQTIAIPPAKADHGEQLEALPHTLDFDLSQINETDDPKLSHSIKKS